MDWFLYDNGLRLERVKQVNVCWVVSRIMMVTFKYITFFQKKKKSVKSKNY